MKMNNFKHTMLTVGVIAALGTTGTTANAAGSSAATGPTITNTATATYKVGTVAQPKVTSNTVTVTINELGSFTLIASQGISDQDNKNEEQKIAPASSVNFKNILENTGNVDDTYTIKLKNKDVASTSLIAGASDDFDYENLASTKIKIIEVTDKDGNVVTDDPDGNAYPAFINPNQTIKLAPHHKAQLSYDVTPDSNNTPDAGESGLIRISATSTYLTAKNQAKSTVINEDQGIITKPIFAIVKTATNTPVDLTQTDPTIQYKITVTNQNKAYSADATNIGIEDMIPTHLELDTSTITVKKSGVAVTGIDTSESTNSKLRVSGINLDKGEIVVVEFTVKVTNATELGKNKSVVNHAAVYDKFGKNDTDPFTSPDTKDSTDSNDDGKNGVDDTKDDQNDSPSIVSLTNRNVDLEDDNTIELAQKDSVVVKHTITNTGNDAEGDNAGELIITVKDTDTTDTIKPTGNIKVEIYAKDKVPGIDAPLATGTVSVDTNGTTDIDIHDISTNGIPSGGKAVVTYTEESANNTDTNGKPKDAQGLTEISVALKDPTTNPSTTFSTDTDTDTFNIGTLELIKEQVLDADCTTATIAATSFTQNSINAQPGQCVIYRITATNKFNETSLTDVTISDKKSNWESAATYVAGSATLQGATAPVTEPTGSNPAVSTTIPEIVKKAQASLLFKVKLKTNVSP